MDLTTRLLRRLGLTRGLDRQIARLRADLEAWSRFAPPGHFYSPLPSREEIAEVFGRAGAGSGPPFAGIDLDEAAQDALLLTLASYYPDLPFPVAAQPGRRYHMDNPSYGAYDAFVLYAMIRHLAPARIIEVGSGFSSAAMLDLGSSCPARRRS